MNFVSYAQLVKDVQAWSDYLPEFSAVMGIPRSGLIPATILALHRNVPMIGVGCAGGKRSIENYRSGPILLVDDSVRTGAAFDYAIREFAPGSAIRAAVYASPDAAHLVDHHYRTLDMPRVFEWNLFHSWVAEQSMFDLDGVICHDPEELEDDTPEWVERWIVNARPKNIPTVKVKAIVTSRLERYRPETEAWLARHGVRYGELALGGWSNAEERRDFHYNAPRLKSMSYSQSDALLFVESSESQAAFIAQESGRPVLCTDTMTMHGEMQCAMT